ncbi:MAG: tetratricopeptide repeat protein [Nitrosopumilaceae archaeon]
MTTEIQDLIEKGKSLLNDGKYDAALECFEKALAIEPTNPHILNQKGVVLRSLGRYDEAIECFNKSLEIVPKDLDAS